MHGYSIDLARTDSSFTKLHKACWLGDEDRAKSAAKKVDVSFQDNESRSPLHLAAARGHLSIVQFLLRAQARVDALDSEGKTPLMKAVEGQHLEVARCLLEQRANPDVPDQNLDTALHLALSTGRPEIAMLLVQFEADVSARNKEGMSPLYMAVVQRHLDVARLLLDRGCQPNAGDNRKKTPLMVAAEAGLVPLVQLLLGRGANANAVDEEGRTALDFARRAGHDECSRLLAAKTNSTHGGEVDNAEVESWKSSSSDSEASRKAKRLRYNVVIPSPSRLSPQASITGHSPSPNHLGIKEQKKPYISSLIVNSATQQQQKPLTNGNGQEKAETHGTPKPALGALGNEKENRDNAPIEKEISPKKKPDKPLHFDENDIASWMEEDVSFEESEAKATSLYVPSMAAQKRNSVVEPELHKSVEVLLAYDGQQLRKNSPNEEEEVVEKLLEEVPKPSKPVADKLSAASDSDWDSTEEVEDVSLNKRSVEGTLGRVDTLQGTEEVWERNQIVVPVNSNAAVTQLPSPRRNPLPTAAPRKSSSSPQRKPSLEQQAQQPPHAEDVGTPQRPPRLSKNRLRSSWSSSSSSAPPSRASPLVIGGSRRPSLLRDNNGRPDSVSPVPADPAGGGNGTQVVRKRSSASSHSARSRNSVDRQEYTTRHVVELTAAPASNIEALVATLQKEIRSTRAELEEEMRHRRKADVFARELEQQLAKREQAIMRDVEAKDTIDSKLADLEQELRSAKGLIKDLHREIEYLQKQLGSYKESADIYKDASEKQEALFKEIISEKEKQWAEEREKLTLRINERDVHSLTARTTSEFAVIQEKLGALYDVLTSLNQKADSAHNIERAEEGISKLLNLSTSALRDLQKLSESAEHASALLHSIDGNLQSKGHVSLTADRNENELLNDHDDDNLNRASATTWTHSLGGINETLGRLEANQRVLTDTLEEIQGVLASKLSGGSPGSEPRALLSNGDVAAAPAVTSSDLSDIKEGVGRVLDRLDFYADEIRKASRSEVASATQKVVEAFGEYHSATKQEMLNLLNKISSQQSALATNASHSVGCEQQDALNASALSDGFAEIRLNQSTALRELQSLKDELIQMDTSGMFARLESCHEKSIEQVSRIVEPVSTELKSMQASMQQQHEDLLGRIGGEGGPRPDQWQDVLHRLDCMLEQTASLRRKDSAGCLRRLSADLGQASPGTDLTAVLSNLATTLTDLKREVHRRGSVRSDPAAAAATGRQICAEEPTTKHTVLGRESSLEDAKLEKEKYRTKRALLKYKSELKGIREKLKNLNHAYDRDGFTSHHPIDHQVADLQRKIDMLSLKVDSNRHYRTDLEISDLRTEMQQIRQQLARQELLRSTLGFTANHEQFEPEETRPKRPEHNGQQQDFLFERHRSDLTAEISNLQRNLSSEPDIHYSWLSAQKDAPEETRKTDVSSSNKSFPRRKPPSQSQSTPYRVPLFPDHLPSWPLSPVQSAAPPPVPTQSASTRQRVQAMLDESFSRHMTARPAFMTTPNIETDGMDAQLKKSLAELTNSLEKTYLV